MSTSLKHLALVVGLTSLVATSGCVTTEQSGLNGPVQDFGGFASKPGATVQLYVYDRQANAWEAAPDTEVIASTVPTNYGGRTIYGWNMNDVNLLETAADDCRISQSCTATPGDSSIRVQLREVGGDFSPLLTFDDGGVSCTISAVAGGADLFAAAWGCKGTVFDELSINIIG
ncbi:MAG: hypothetical protein ACRBN8_24275 [Nannocystales bacterium]